ncbi:MAG: sulfotransferase [Acidobacteria bacterium]|nr:sulfotransferase [Acidobacteriota bacterium]
MKQILYVLGSGRSGSTLLDIILGSADGIFSCGELRRFRFNVGVPLPHPHRAEVVEFWKNISLKVSEKLSERKGTDWEKLCHRIEYHTRFIAPWRFSGRAMESYGKYVNTLADTIFEETGADWLVDSSKYPGRLLALLKVSKYPVSVIYLTRHPVGVVRSFSRMDVEQPGKGFWAANHYYGVNGLLCCVAYRQVSAERRLKMRYENLVKKPEWSLAKIEKKFGMNMKIPISIAAAGEAFRIGHLVGGNRIRLNNEIFLKPLEDDFAWDVKSVLTRIMNRIWY